MTRTRSLALTVLLSMLLALLAACGGSTTGNPTTAPTTGTGANPTQSTAANTPVADNTAPAVPNADAAKAFSGATIIYYGDSVGQGAAMDDMLAQRFTADTGINVQVIRKPESPTDAYDTYQRFFSSQSADIDVMMLDVIWPAAFGQHLLDLKPKLGEVAADHYEGIIANNTVNGQLVAIPWFGDFGILYYRTDLLEKYNFDGPPETWQELTEMATTIQEGERASSPDFTGFVFQGVAKESLTCNALEWIASSGGGTFLEDGKVTFNNEGTIEMLRLAQSWVGTISPQGVTGYGEEDARNVFQGGNAAFMRNWPYAYALGNADDSPVKGKFDVAPLPHSEGGESVGTVGGWQLGVSKYSKSPDASIEFVRYMTSAEVQKWRAVEGSFVPTIPAVAEDADVIAAMPFLQNLADVQRVARPSSSLATNYNQGSTIIFQSVNQVLLGQMQPEQAVQAMSQQLERLASR